MIKVLFFGQLRELLAVSELTLEDTPNTVADLKRKLALNGPLWQEYLSANDTLVAVNQTMAQADSQLHSNDEVAFFPPVTGG